MEAVAADWRVRTRGRSLRDGGRELRRRPPPWAAGTRETPPRPLGLDDPPRSAAWKASGVVIFRLKEMLLFSACQAMGPFVSRAPHKWVMFMIMEMSESGERGSVSP